MKNIFTYLYPEELYLEQPELGTWMIKFKGSFLFIINLLGFKRFSKFLIWAEDASIIFIIFNLAKNFKYIYKYGILHYKSNSTASFRQSKDIRIFGEIFFLDVIYDFSTNSSESKNLIVGQAIFIHDRYGITKFNN